MLQIIHIVDEFIKETQYSAILVQKWGNAVIFLCACISYFSVVVLNSNEKK